MHKLIFLMAIISGSSLAMEGEVTSTLVDKYLDFCVLVRSLEHNPGRLNSAIKEIITLQDRHPDIPQSFYVLLFERHELSLLTGALAASKAARRIAYSQIDASIAQLPDKPDLYNFKPDRTLIIAVDYISGFEGKIIIANRLLEILRKKAGL
jgi:hypothetical protein